MTMVKQEADFHFGSTLRARATLWLFGHRGTSYASVRRDLPNGLEMSRPASAQSVSRTRFAAAGRVGSIELLASTLVAHFLTRPLRIVSDIALRLSSGDHRCNMLGILSNTNQQPGFLLVEPRQAHK